MVVAARRPRAKPKPKAGSTRPHKGKTVNQQARPRLVISDGAPIKSATALLTFDAEKPSSISPDQIVIDRDKLRELRMSTAAKDVAAKAKGDQTLAEIARRKAGSNYVHMINPYDLHFEENHNPRDFATSAMRQRVASYADSIAQRGVRQPLDVYVKDNRLYVNGGETRWRATLHALNFLNVPIEGIPCITTHGENDAERKIGQWLGNDTYRFEPMAEANLFRTYIDLGGDVAVFARRIGHPPSYIQQRVRLLEMPAWLQRKVQDGTVPPRVAYEKIWLASREKNDVAQQLLAASLASAKAEQAERGVDAPTIIVRPRHVEAAAEGSQVSTKIIRTKYPDRLAALIRHRDREQWIEFLGEELAAEMFKLANIKEVE